MAHNWTTPHGHASTYKSGCRCDDCREAVRVAQREYYRKRGGNKNRKPEHNATSLASQKAKREERKAAGLPAQPWTEGRKAADQRRRAAKLGATVEKFTPAEIFERDRWKCGVCARKVRTDLAYPDPKSASLDHIVPLSEGGEHSRANARLAHLDCNVQRSNRGGGEQLLLVG